jgi:hypothetical protein
MATLAKGVGEVAFDPDSSRMAIAEKDGTVRLMFWHPQSLVDEACARVGRDFTVQEWQTYFAEDEHQPICRELRAPLD